MFAKRRTLAVALLALGCTERQNTSAARVEAAADSSPAMASAAGQDSAAIAQLHEQWIRAFQQHDPKLLEPLLADDFVAYGPEPGTKQQMIEAVMDTAATLESVSHNELRVRVLGSARDVAVVTGSVTAKVRHQGKPVSMRNRYTEVWVKRGGRWQCVGGQYYEFPAKG